MSISKVKTVIPPIQEWEKKLDKLISLHLKHTLEESDHRFVENLDTRIETMDKILKFHDDLVADTNELIKKTCSSLKTNHMSWKGDLREGWHESGYGTSANM